MGGILWGLDITFICKKKKKKKKKTSVELQLRDHSRTDFFASFTQEVVTDTSTNYNKHSDEFNNNLRPTVPPKFTVL